MDQDRLKEMRPMIYKLAPFEEVRMDGRTTISLLACDVPFLILRINSDGLRIYEGETVPVASTFVKLVNPYHFPVTATVGVGYAVRQITRAAPTPEQACKISSVLTLGRAIVTTGLKYGYGVMLKRGSATLSWLSGTDSGATQMIIFPNARADFLSFKPAGAMNENYPFRMLNGDIDTNVISCGGTYSDADVVAWTAAAGYSGQIYHYPGIEWAQTLMPTVSDSCAVFISRAIDVAARGCIRIMHQGLNVEDFD